MSNPLQQTVDIFWDKTLFRIVPKFIIPNHFTFLRFALIPVTLYFLGTERFGWALIMFGLAALADSIDGSLARIRNQVTDYGIMLDPMADKFLIVLSALFLFFYYPYVELLAVVVIIDVLIGLQGLLLMITKKNVKTPPADWSGKSKMVFQVFGLLSIMFYLITNSPILLSMSVVIIYLAIFSGVISMFTYGYKAYLMLGK